MEKKQLTALLEQASYPKETICALMSDYEQLLCAPACRQILEEARARYRAGAPLSYYEESDRLVKEAEKETTVHPYAAELLFYLHLAPILKEQYEKEGLPARYFDGVMAGILCKLMECHRMYGIWGSFVAIWFARFFCRSLYAIGRLEFCLMACPLDFSSGQRQIKKGEPVIDVHIPSRGPLTAEELEASYLEAAAFFAPKLKGQAVFHCESWLLADFHSEMLPESSGIRLFARRYHLIEQTPDEGDFWRIFYLPSDTPPQTLPEQTALQRGYKKRLLQGLDLYGGRGIFFLEPSAKNSNK